MVDTSCRAGGAQQKRGGGELGINYINARPYRPQTYGKVERFHQHSKE